MHYKRTPAKNIPYKNVKEALKDEPELFDLWQEIIGTPPKNVIPLDRQAYNLPAGAIKSIIKFIKKIEEEEGRF